jgi:aerobic-type carbon monoxide dehydrogenase small subunit (CoxS/CutS family)
MVIINGKSYAVQAQPDRPLLEVLREELDLTGTKYGCGEGQCGACTVLVEGRPVKSCITRLSAVAGKRVTTIEGLVRKDGGLHPMQQAFLKHGALQCGYCTPGMLMAAAGLLAQNPHPSEAEIGQALEGNVCRCGTYPRIIAAVREASRA